MRGLFLYLSFIPFLFVLSRADGGIETTDCADRLAARTQGGEKSLAELDQNEQPWLTLESEQRYYYLGNTPREIALGLPPKPNPILLERLRVLGDSALKRISRKLKLDSVQFEIWPNFDDWGSVTWVVGRYRETPRHAWKWLDSSFYPRDLAEGPADPTLIVLPKMRDPQEAKDNDLLFENYAVDLYQRPEFGEAVWMTRNLGQVLGAWLPPSQMHAHRKRLENSGAIAIVVPPPARFNGHPLTFLVNVRDEKTEWPDSIQWETEARPTPVPIGPQQSLVNWPDDFNDLYFEDIKRFSGVTPIESPVSGKTIDFGKLGAGQKDNQLLDLLAFLRKDYERLGFGRSERFTIEEQAFTWFGIPQANLILKIRGYLPSSQNRPFILTDHIDKAIAEDIFEKTKQRVSNPGADDNGTATAALRQAARILTERYKRDSPAHDIWIVHFTGEEYPSSCSGSRHFVSELLRRKQKIGGNINMDMLGHRTQGDRIFQINPGYSPGSWTIGCVALAVAKAQGGGWLPTMRYPWSRQSYINQTDSSMFDWAGYPTILINEHMNLSRRVNPYYHKSSDLPHHIDVEYAAVQARVAIETAIRLAESVTFPDP